jgi:4-aminobutyrate aminotransferase
MSAAAVFGQQHIARGIGRLSEHVLQRGAGSWVWTDEGVRLLDLTMGIGVVGCGHCHPVITAAAVEQMGMIQHAQVRRRDSCVAACAARARASAETGPRGCAPR